MMQEVNFYRILNFLLGASWAFIVLGALITFKTFIILGFSLSLFITLLFVLLSFFMILVLDAFVINRKRLKELEKQTKLLEEIRQNRV